METAKAAKPRMLQRIHVVGEDGSVRAHRVHGKFGQRQGRPLGMSLKEGAACAACKIGLISLSPLAQAAVPEMAIVDQSARKCPGNLATGTVGTERVVRATTLELPGAGSTTAAGRGDAVAPALARKR